MRYFFIDLENVRSEGLEGVLSLAGDDMVFIFYSDNAMNLSIPTLENLNNSKASKKFIKTNYIGKNAMDFQIVSLFGAMIEREKTGSYYIISQDNGFRSAVSFCESYFESYGIICGVAPTIIAAITDELKKTTAVAGKKASACKKDSNGTSGKEQVKREAFKNEAVQNAANKNAAEQKNANKNTAEQKVAVQPQTPEQKDAGQSSVQSEAVGSADSGKSSGRKSKRSKHKSPDNRQSEQPASAAETVAQPQEQDRQADKESEVEAAESPVPEESSSEIKKKKKRRRGKKKQSAGNSDATESRENTLDESDSFSDENSDVAPEVNRKQYIYDILSELLSEKTIDIYASAIDEGIAGCANREELHSFFLSRFGEDEGEALYRVVQGDFEKMKQNRPKKSSRRRHRPRTKQN